jgi:hypothetical protein
MTLNTSKTKAMLISSSSNSRVPTVFSSVELVTSYKFLGVMIDNNMNFNAHISYIVNKAHKRFYGLVQLKRIGVSSEKLCMFYVANIRSVLTYCISAFYSLLSSKQMEALERTQRICTKIILPDVSSYTELLQILSLPTVQDFSLNLYRKKFLNIYACEHPLSKFIPERQSSQRSSVAKSTRKPRKLRV